MIRVAVVESAYRTRNHYLAVSLVSALRRDPSVAQVDLLELSNAIPRTQSGIDLLIVFGGEEADNIVIHKLIARARVSAIWFTEDPYESTRNISVAKNFDLIFTNDRRSADRYGDSSAHLPLAAERKYTERFRPFEQRRYDVSFVGTLWPNRAEFFSEAEPLLRDVRKKFELLVNEHLRPSLAGISMPYASGSGVDYSDFMRIAEHSLTALQIDRDFSSSGSESVADTPGPRFFEAGSAGACVLVDLRESDNLKSLGFLDGRHYLGFKSIAEFAGRIAELRNFPEKFAEIGLALQQKIAASHTYDARAAVILERARALLSARIRKPARQPSRRILALSHNLSQFGNFGGGELYLEHLITGCDYDITTFSHDSAGNYGHRYVMADKKLNVLSEFRPKIPYSDVNVSHTELESVFIEKCIELQPSVLLVNHLLGFPPSLPLIAKHLGIPYVVVLHDYYTVCDEFTLSMPQHVYCRLAEPDSDICDGCTYKRRGFSPGAQARRRSYYRRVLSGADRLVSNTKAATDIIAAIAGVALPACAYIEPPILTRRRGAQDLGGITKLESIAFVGNVREHKGASDLLEIATSIQDTEIQFKVFGSVDQSFVRAVKARQLNNITIYGSFSSGQIPDEVGRCQAALFLSRWPETYCMTLTETMELGCVPIAYSIGALAERVTEDIGFRAESVPQEVVKIIRSLISDPTPLIERAALLKRIAGRKCAFVSSYDKLFSEIIADQSSSEATIQAPFHYQQLGLNWLSNRWDISTLAHEQSATTSLVNGGSTLIPAAKKKKGLPLLRSAVSTIKSQGLSHTAARVRSWLNH